MTDKAIKLDQEKPRMELLSRIWLWAVSRVLTKGAKKYSDDNWRKGFPQRRLCGAALRHITAYMDGETLDPETGECHLDHASCMLMFARENLETHPELDDRPKIAVVKAKIKYTPEDSWVEL